MKPFAEAVLVVAGVYVSLGLAFSLAFLFRGLGVVDPAAKASGVAFRMIIWPGITILWPLLAWRWYSMSSRTSSGDLPAEWVAPPLLRRIHYLAWWFVLLAGPLILGSSLYWRPKNPDAQSVPASQPLTAP